MMKEVVRALDPGILPQIGLIAFATAFVLVVVYAFTLSRKQRAELKNLPLDEPARLPHGDWERNE